MAGPGCTASIEGGSGQNFYVTSRNCLQAHLLPALGHPPASLQPPPRYLWSPLLLLILDPQPPHLPAPPWNRALGHSLYQLSRQEHGRGLFSTHLPDADSAQPSSTTILLLGRGAWHLGAQLLGALALGSSAPCPASEASGPGPSWASEHQQLAGSCHLLFSEH